MMMNINKNAETTTPIDQLPSLEWVGKEKGWVKKKMNGKEMCVCKHKKEEFRDSEIMVKLSHSPFLDR